MTTEVPAATVDLEELLASTKSCQTVITDLFNYLEAFEPLFPSSLTLYTICGALTLQLDQVERVILTYAPPPSKQDGSTSPDSESTTNYDTEAKSDPLAGLNWKVIRDDISDFHTRLDKIYQELRDMAGFSSSIRSSIPRSIRLNPDLNNLTKKLGVEHKRFSTFWGAFYVKNPELRILKGQNHVGGGGDEHLVKLELSERRRTAGTRKGTRRGKGTATNNGKGTATSTDKVTVTSKGKGESSGTGTGTGKENNKSTGKGNGPTITPELPIFGLFPDASSFQVMRTTEFQHFRYVSKTDPITGLRSRCTILKLPCQLGYSLYTVDEGEATWDIVKERLGKLDRRDHVLTAMDIQRRGVASVYYQVPHPYHTLKELFQPPPHCRHEELWPSLVDRVRVAFQIIQAVHAVHFVRLVHGSICAEYILMAGCYHEPKPQSTSGGHPRLDDDSKKDLAVGTPLLGGFHTARPFNCTVPYQGSVGGSVLDDILSDCKNLGMLLVQIALWKDLIPKHYRTTASTPYETRAWYNARSHNWSDSLVDVAWRVGDRYAEAARWCLEVPDDARTNLETVRKSFRQNVYEAFENIVV